jgi:hypothetical protein
LENQRSVDQRRKRVETFLAERSAPLARQGAVVATWRRRGGRRVGPYFLLVCRSAAGRQASVYLGPTSALVEDVSKKLAQLQAPLQERRALDLVRRQLRQELKIAQKALAAELAQVGLFRKGSEIRGWARHRAQRHAAAIGSGFDPRS